jgi:hypothetical protein
MVVAGCTASSWLHDAAVFRTMVYSNSIYAEYFIFFLTIAFSTNIYNRYVIINRALTELFISRLIGNLVILLSRNNIQKRNTRN